MSSNNGRFNTGLGINQLVNQVQEDPNLNPGEKETCIRFAKPDDIAHVYTEEAGITRRLLRYPHFNLEEWRVVNGNVWGKRIGANDYNGETVTGVQGHVPVSSVKLQASPRSASGHARIVSRE